jgi:hypothetical protein
LISPSGSELFLFPKPLHPDDDLKIYWDISLMVLLVIIGVITPFRVCIVDDEDQEYWIIFDYMTDFLFGLDLLLNFFTAYYEAENKLETRYYKIAFNYISGWFAIDAIAL